MAALDDAAKPLWSIRMNYTIEQLRGAIYLGTQLLVIDMPDRKTCLDVAKAIFDSHSDEISNMQAEILGVLGRNEENLEPGRRLVEMRAMFNR